jgi:hypothetical protein
VQVRLNLQPGTGVYDLQVSSDGLWACFRVLRCSEEGPSTDPHQIRLVDLRSGKVTVLTSGKPLEDCWLSPSGEKALLCELDKAYLLDLRTTKRQQIPIAEGDAIGGWMGKKLMLESFGPDGKGIYGIKSYDPEDGKIQKFPTIGSCLVADPEGRTLVARVRAGATDKPLTEPDTWLVSLNAKGEVTRTLCKDATVEVVISPSSRWVAFLTGVEAANTDDGGKSAAGIVDMKLGETTSVRVAIKHSNASTLISMGSERYQHLVGITDSGGVLAMEEAPDTGEPSRVDLYRDGKATTLVQAALCPVYAGGRLYYIDGTGAAAVLMSVDVPN